VVTRLLRPLWVQFDPKAAGKGQDAGGHRPSKGESKEGEKGELGLGTQFRKKTRQKVPPISLKTERGIIQEEIERTA